MDSRTVPTLSLLAPLAVIAVVFLLFFREPAGGSRDVLMYTLGALTIMAKDVYGFYFGSSLGSRQKDRVLQEREPTP